MRQTNYSRPEVLDILAERPDMVMTLDYAVHLLNSASDAAKKNTLQCSECRYKCGISKCINESCIHYIVSEKLDLSKSTDYTLDQVLESLDMVRDIYYSADRRLSAYLLYQMSELLKEN